MPDQHRQRHSVVIPRRPRRRSALRRVFRSLAVFVGCIALAVVGVGLYGFVKYAGPGPLAKDTVFQVERGGVLGIASDLEKAGVISNAAIFTAAAAATGSRGRLKPGEYQFKQAMSMRAVMALIVSGKSIIYRITVPEGWTTAQALERLRENEVLTGDISLAPSEGQIMPDTYPFQRGESRDSVVKRMMSANQKLMEELWPQKADNAPVKTPAEALILASIIEKETGVADERARVASVFANRLKRGMRLQSDPTIIYGITGGKTKLDRPLTKKDIAQATPYNTYHISGLPPGPIANPGRAALEAALAPAKTNDLYFVADGSGGHVFAATLEEHRVNVRKWREIERQRIREGDEAPVMDEADLGAPAETAVVEAAPEPQVKAPDNALVVPGAETPADLPATQPAAEPAVEPPVQEAEAVQVPIPRPKPPRQAATTVADAADEFKPGSVIKGVKGLIPIPVPKPKSP